MSRIQGNVPVIGYFPFLSFEENFSLTNGMGYDTIVSLFCKEIAVNINNIILSRVDKLGWHSSIIKDKPQLDIELGIIDIQPGDRIVVSKQRDTVGMRKYLKSLNIYSDNSRVSELMNNYCGWRSIKGDGNCYYRAVYFSLFEQIIARKQFNLFGNLHNKFSSVIFEDEADQEEHQEFLDLLGQQSSDDLTWSSVNEFEYEVLNSDSVLDEACVRACRWLVSDYIISNQDVALNDSGISIKEAVLPSYKDVK